MSDNGGAPEPQLVPLNAIFADDFVELLIPVMSNNTMAEVAGAVAHHAEGVRVRPRDAHKRVYHNNRVLPDDMTVAEAGIGPLDHIRVDYDD
ncbi:MAG: toluene-4-monooxygenase system B family protein [bacterium]|nr:toluene-4-monooxygenase system B family protein [bacterium]MDE0289163.1 toluene-4-monooxygenase system B family protein [bacterium]MDE0377204.1 toluene-4-monooxygenase system B family protein [bacterium]